MQLVRVGWQVSICTHLRGPISRLCVFWVHPCACLHWICSCGCCQIHGCRSFLGLHSGVFEHILRRHAKKAIDQNLKLRSASFFSNPVPDICHDNSRCCGCSPQIISRCFDGIHTTSRSRSKRDLCTLPADSDDSEPKQLFCPEGLFASSKKQTAGKGRKVGATHWLLLDPPTMELQLLGTGTAEPSTSRGMPSCGIRFVTHGRTYILCG